MPRREVESPVVAPKLISSCAFQILHDPQHEWCVQFDALKLQNEAWGVDVQNDILTCSATVSCDYGLKRASLRLNVLATIYNLAKTDYWASINLRMIAMSS
eukprot:scaffold150568_cov19-Prasinocladus_malaysianus.AAC.1